MFTLDIFNLSFHLFFPLASFFYQHFISSLEGQLIGEELDEGKTSGQRG